MINSVLFKKTIRSSYKIVLIILAVLIMYVAIITHMYDPDDMGAIQSLADMKFPPELLNAFGFDLNSVKLTGFIASFLYGMIMLVFPMIMYMVLANRYIASMVDKGSMACLLSTPNSRRKISFTSALTLVLSVLFLITVITAVILCECEYLFSGELDVWLFIKMNTGLFLLHFMLSSICFCASCIFNESKTSLIFGAGIPVLMFVLQMLAQASKDLDKFKYTTLFTLYNASDIAAGKTVLPQFVAMAIIGLILYTAGIIVFDKKDIPL